MCTKCDKEWLAQSWSESDVHPIRALWAEGFTTSDIDAFTPHGLFDRARNATRGR